MDRWLGRTNLENISTLTTRLIGTCVYKTVASTKIKTLECHYGGPSPKKTLYIHICLNMFICTYINA